MVSRYPEKCIDRECFYTPSPGGKPPCEIARNWDGSKPVSVVWLASYLSWQQAEFIGRDPTWMPRWFAYVIEFDAFVPQGDLLRINVSSLKKYLDRNEGDIS